ncbi:hypothetical protein GCM10010518_15660 [Kitasatospora cinereorecta]
MGYVVVSYNVRGFWQSEGEIEVAGPQDIVPAVSGAGHAGQRRRPDEGGRLGPSETMSAHVEEADAEELEIVARPRGHARCREKRAAPVLEDADPQRRPLLQAWGGGRKVAAAATAAPFSGIRLFDRR